MKRCPECRRDYYDDSLLYCLDDGSALLEGPSSGGESKTAILHETEPPSEAPTKHQIHTTDQTAIFRGSPEAVPQIKLGDLAERRSRSANRAAKPLVLLGLAILILILGFFGYRYFASNSREINSIAVLPFENRSGDPDSDYLSEGLAESLIYRLSQLPDLKVSSTSAVFRYKGKEIDPQKIGSELGVGAVMTGRIAQRGDNLAISVEIVDVSSGKVLWGEQYDRKASELLATQREIAKEIVENLKLKVSPQEKALTKHYTESNEAYQFYLRGRFYWNKRTGENLKKAIEQFQEAADADPNFALAYTGLADCYSLLEEYAGIPSSETLPKARTAAKRALELDDSLAEAHTSVAYANFLSWKPADAEAEYKRAFDRNPNYPTAHQWYSHLLRVGGRYEEAMAEIRRAQQLDPLSPIISENVGNMEVALNGDLDSASAEYRKVLEIDPNFPVAHGYLGLTLLDQGRMDEGIAELQKAVQLSGNGVEMVSFLGFGYGRAGRKAEAIAVLKDLEARYDRRESPAICITQVYAGLGDKDQAFAWLEKDYQARAGQLVFIGFYPHLIRALQDDPRYTDLLRRMGFR